jgi:hypothetical protein
VLLGEDTVIFIGLGDMGTRSVAFYDVPIKLEAARA